MARIVVLALLCAIGCSRESAPMTTPTTVRLPPIAHDKKLASEPPPTAPKRRLTVSKTPESYFEKRALAAVTRWLDETCPNGYDVELFVAAEHGDEMASVTIVYRNRDEGDQPITWPGGHAFVQIDSSGEVERVFHGR